MIMQTLAVVMLLMLGGSIYVNTNDIDGWLWIGLYLFAALLTIERVFPRAMPWLGWGLGLTCLGWGIKLMIKVISERSFFHEVHGIGEEGREFVALLIVGLWLVAMRRFGGDADSGSPIQRV